MKLSFHPVFAPFISTFCVVAADYYLRLSKPIPKVPRTYVSSSTSNLTTLQNLLDRKRDL